MAHYTKLWSFILDSTIWAEDDHTRLVWITMLAMCDQGGFVHASVPGLAARARVPLPSCEKALVTLRAPDLYSRTKEYDGRRIEDVDGGWMILNYEKHREAMDEEKRRERNRERQRKWREKRNAAANNVTRDITVNNAKQAYAQAQQASAEARASAKNALLACKGNGGTDGHALAHALPAAVQELTQQEQIKLLAGGDPEMDRYTGVIGFLSEIGIGGRAAKEVAAITSNSAASARSHWQDINAKSDTKNPQGALLSRMGYRSKKRSA